MKKAYIAVLTILLVSLSAALTPSQSGGTFVITQSVVSNGGAKSDGGSFTVTGTAGQNAAGTNSTGGIFGASGGFWSIVTSASGSPTPTPSVSISGTVTYGNAAVPPKYISNATVTGTGSPNVFTTTVAPGGTAGQYLLSGFGAGSYTVSLSKTTGVNSITLNDAARIAQHVTGALLLTNDRQKVAADVTNNGAISSNDAAKIAQYAAGLPFSPPNLTGQWRFFVPPGPTFPVAGSPTSRTYPSVTSSIAGDDYIGLLIGDVTGNWSPSAARPGGEEVGSMQLAVGSDDSGTNEKPITVTAGDIIATVDKEIIVPVNVQNVAEKGIVSYEFDLRYDPSVIQPHAEPLDVVGTVSHGLSVVANATEPGLLRVVVYGPMPIEIDGVLLNLRFTPVGAPGSASSLTWERIMFNEGQPGATVTDGSIELF